MIEPPGSHDICHICRWEDDWVQTLDPRNAGGANQVSLIEAQANFQRFGAKTPGHKYARPPSPDYEREPEWRPIDPELDLIGANDELIYSAPTPPEMLEMIPGAPDRIFGGASNPEEFADPTRLYWWRPTYWRRNRKASR